jgi:hypothetical protein
MRIHYLVLTATALSALIACGSSASTDEPRPEKARATACELVTGAEMSVILGGKVVPKINDRSAGKTECIYTAAEGVSPYAELSLEWGSGADAMLAADMMNKREPGIADPYEGVGDQAVAVGPTLMIRSGDDLITLVFSGVDDVPARARRIYDTVKARM